MQLRKRLVQDGFKVGVLDYNPETAEKAVAELSAENAFAVVADVSETGRSCPSISKVVDHFGDLNVVVNNAGVAQLLLLIQLLRNNLHVLSVSTLVVSFGVISCTSAI